MFFDNFKLDIYFYADLFEIFRFKKKKKEFKDILYRTNTGELINKVITNVGEIVQFEHTKEYRDMKIDCFWRKTKFAWAPQYSIDYKKKIFFTENLNKKTKSDIKIIENKILCFYEKKPILIKIYIFPKNVLLIKMSLNFKFNGTEKENHNMLTSMDIIKFLRSIYTYLPDISEKDQFCIEINKGRKPRKKEECELSLIFYSIFKDIFNWVYSYHRRTRKKKKQKVIEIRKKFIHNDVLYKINSDLFEEAFSPVAFNSFFVLKPRSNYYRNCETNWVYKITWLDLHLNNMDHRTFDLHHHGQILLTDDCMCCNCRGSYLYPKEYRYPEKYYANHMRVYFRLKNLEYLIQFNWLRLQSFFRLIRYIRDEMIKLIGYDSLKGVAKTITNQLSWLNDSFLSSFKLIGRIEDDIYFETNLYLFGAPDNIKESLNYDEVYSNFCELKKEFINILSKIKAKNWKKINESIKFLFDKASDFLSKSSG